MPLNIIFKALFQLKENALLKMHFPAVFVVSSYNFAPVISLRNEVEYLKFLNQNYHVNLFLCVSVLR